jgi:hypothetical protein
LFDPVFKIEWSLPRRNSTVTSPVGARHPALGSFAQHDGLWVKTLAVQRYRLAFLQTHRDFFTFDFNVIAPESHTHDGIDDFYAAIEVLKVLASCVAPSMLESVD